MRSYTSLSGLTQVKNLWRQFRYVQRVGTPAEIGPHPAVGDVRQIEAEAVRRLGRPINELKVLEIGAGQVPTRLIYFATRTEAIGIDSDAVPGAFDVRGYFLMLRQNGPLRVIKTLVRRLMGIDARRRRALRQSLGVRRLPTPRVLQMDAARMTFQDSSFDLVYSADTFEHLHDPGAVLREIIRVLRPGGCCYLEFQPYSAEDGAHDLRLFCDDRDGIPFWPHLRPQHQHLVQPSCYTNGILLPQWRELFSQWMPGSTVECTLRTDPRLLQGLHDIRLAGELADYTDEDLLLNRAVALWQKPTAG